MCHPAVGIALGVGQGVSSFIGARNLARAQETAQRNASLAENERLSAEQISLRQQQQEEAQSRSQRLQAAALKASSASTSA